MHEGELPEVKPRHREEFANRGMPMKYVRLIWQLYLADGTDLKAVPMLEKQDALTRPASPITSAAKADDEVSAGRLPSSRAVPDDKDCWAMGDLVEFDAEERIGVKCRLRYLQESCRVKGQEDLENIVQAVCLAAELIVDARIMSSGAVDVADPRIDESTGQLASTRAEVIPLTSKLYDLGKVCDKARLKHEKF